MNSNVTVNRQTAITSSTVTTANKTFRFENGKNGVVLSQGKNTFTIPSGATGRAILAELGAILGENVSEVGAVSTPRRKRRTKAEMEAARANGEGGSENDDALNAEIDNLLDA